MVAVLAPVPLLAQHALVLGGGGARGLAHAGAVAGLEQLGYDPDLVVGTSMGAIIGALFAAGLTGDSIRKVVIARDWRELFNFQPQILSPGQDGRYALFQLGLLVDRGRHAEGLVADVRVNRLLTRVFFDASARARSDFDQLPRRFRAMAADLSTGQAIVLDRGDLARAVRASMSVPGVFAPVIWDARELVDGGIADYLPVGVAKRAGYDRVIGVDVIRPPARPQGLNPFQIAVRTFRLALRNARLERIEPDVLVLPALDPDLSAAFFPRDATALIEIGRAAALRDAPPMGDPAVPRRSRAAPDSIVQVVVESGDRSLAELVEHAFGRTTGAYHPAAVLAAVDRLYATGLFHGIWPRVEQRAAGDPDQLVLAVRVDALPPTLVSGALGYDRERGVHLWASLRGRPFGDPTELMLAAARDELDQHGSLSMRRAYGAMASLSFVAGIGIEKANLNIDSAGRAVERDVRRARAWLGLDWRGFEPDRAAGLWLRADQIEDQAEGRSGAAIGPYARFGRVNDVWRVVGVPWLVEAEARGGEVAYRRARLRGSLDAEPGALQFALFADVSAASRDAPLDVHAALGDERLVPGLAWGRERGRARVVAGLDVAYPIVLDGHARMRLRTGSVATTIDALEEARWVSGAELGVVWPTPFGRFEAGIGIARAGRPRLTLGIGPLF